jgi:hypothetical protein
MRRAEAQRAMKKKTVWMRRQNLRVGALPLAKSWRCAGR